MGSILLVEDSAELRLIISEVLEQFQVTAVASAEEAQLALKNQVYDLILLDLQLPGKTGMWLLSELQTQSHLKTIPVLCITGNPLQFDKIQAFKLGAEDYISKPFNLLELQAKIDSRMRKILQTKPNLTRYQISDLEINPVSQEVTLLSSERPKAIELTGTEFKLLSLLASSPNHFFTRDKILASTWTEKVSVTSRVIDVHVCSLRRKLKESLIQIESRVGRGYRLKTAPEMEINEFHSSLSPNPL